MDKYIIYIYDIGAVDNKIHLIITLINYINYCSLLTTLFARN